MPADTQQLTPWFKNRKPWVVGVYKQKSGLGTEIGYQYWDGAYWHTWQHTPEAAERVARSNRSRVDLEHQNDPWRGLKEPSK